LTALNQMMGGRPDTDQERVSAERAYERVLEWASRNGDQLDQYWDRYARSCIERAAAPGDRAWFAVFEARDIRVTGHSAYDCEGWLNDVRKNANQIRAEIVKGGEAARQSGVFPGTLRDMRHRYRLGWPGWER